MTNSILSLTSPTDVAYSSDKTSPAATSYADLTLQHTDDQILRIASRLVMSLKPTEQLIACAGVRGTDPSTSFAVYTSLALARLGSGPVLLLDANFNNRKQLEKGEAVAPGFTDLLSEESSEITAIQNTDIDGLDLLAVGNCSLPATSLLSSARMALLMKYFRKYRFVIIDVGAILDSTEALMMTSKADVVIAVASTGQRTKRELSQFKTEVDRLKTNFLGVVLTDVR